MRFIETNVFLQQLSELSEKYKKVFDDYEDMKMSFNPNFSTSLWDWFYKERVKNSSIPTWKRWWFRFIVKVFEDKAIPLMIYSKSHKENVTQEEIKNAMKKVIEEISSNKS